jgi:hypothetical protein
LTRKYLDVTLLLQQSGPGEKQGEAMKSPEQLLLLMLLLLMSVARRNPKGGAMGILGKLFSGGEDYPALDSSTPAARQLESVRSPLEKLAGETGDPLEVVPAEDSVVIFIGKPPKKFGVAWIEDGDKIVNFKSLVDEKGLSPTSLENLSEKLRKAYIAHQDKPRYVTKISDREVVVIPSTSLMNNVKGVVEQTIG